MQAPESTTQSGRIVTLEHILPIPSHDTALKILINQADQALYQAKQNGRNGYAVASAIHD